MTAVPTGELSPAEVRDRVLAGQANTPQPSPGSHGRPDIARQRADPTRPAAVPQGQIIAVTGKNPAPLFRFPYDDADARTIAIVNQAGYVAVRWTVDTPGWEGTAGRISATAVAARVPAGLRPGEVVLMHVGSTPDDHTTFDANALPQVSTELRARGYSFVTLDALPG